MSEATGGVQKVLKFGDIYKQIAQGNKICWLCKEEEKKTNMASLTNKINLMQVTDTCEQRPTKNIKSQNGDLQLNAKYNTCLL